MSKVIVQVELHLNKPLRGAEDERYLCESIREGISYGWYEYMMTEESMPAEPKRTVVRMVRPR